MSKIKLKRTRRRFTKKELLSITCLDIYRKMIEKHWPTNKKKMTVIQIMAHLAKIAVEKTTDTYGITWDLCENLLHRIDHAAWYQIDPCLTDEELVRAYNARKGAFAEWNPIHDWDPKDD